jgi:hypothetical protein
VYRAVRVCVNELDEGHIGTSVCGLQLLVYRAVRVCVNELDEGHVGTSVCGLKLLVYRAVRVCVNELDERHIGREIPQPDRLIGRRRYQARVFIDDLEPDNAGVVALQHVHPRVFFFCAPAPQVSIFVLVY